MTTSKGAWQYDCRQMTAAAFPLCHWHTSGATQAMLTVSVAEFANEAGLVADLAAAPSGRAAIVATHEDDDAATEAGKEAGGALSFMLFL